MISMWMAFVVMALTLFFMSLKLNQKRVRKDKGKTLMEIPGPPALPLLGNIFQLVKAFKSHTYPLSTFAEEYGEIYRLKIPFDEIVVVASYAAVCDVFSRDEAMGRDSMGIMIDRTWGLNLGIAFSNGEMWKKSRAWTVRNLRDFGFGKSHSLEVAVNVEVSDFLGELKDKEDQNGQLILPISQTFLVPVSTVMYKMMAGVEASIDKATLVEMNAQTSLLEKASGPTGTAGAALAIYLPSIRFLFPEWTGRNIQLSCRSTMQNESTRLRDAAVERMSKKGAQPESLTEKFVAEMTQGSKRKNDSEIFTERNHDILFSDLFQASSNTTSSFLEALFLFTVLHPEVQERIYGEILDTVPIGHEATFEDKNRMIYTQAVMLETHRVAKIVQHLLPRRALADFDYKNFRIKKNSMIIAEMNSVFTDPSLFQDPTTFKPERFIDSNGNLVNEELIIAFSVGKRNCPGELFAEVTAFLMFINVLKKYKLSTVPGEDKPREDMHVGITSCPYPFSVMMTKREGVN